MIKINLLGEGTVRDNTGLYLVLGYVASMTLLFIVLIATWSSLSSTVEDMRSESVALETQLKKLESVTKEVHELEAKKKELRDKLAVIATLKRNKIGPVRVMDDLNKSLPEKAWITDVKEREGSFLIIGKALDDQTIATFMRNLEQSDFYGPVDLVESHKVTVQGAKISEFSIDAKINYVGKLAAATPAASATPAEKPGPK